MNLHKFTFGRNFFFKLGISKKCWDTRLQILIYMKLSRQFLLIRKNETIGELLVSIGIFKFWSVLLMSVQHYLRRESGMDVKSIDNLDERKSC